MCSKCDELNDDLSDIFGGDLTDETREAGFAIEAAEIARTKKFEEPCFKCRGTGRFVGYTGRVLGNCFTCKGTGKLGYKTSSEERASNRQKAAQKREEKAQAATDTAQAWLDANPAEADWLTSAAARGFEFAVSLKEALFKYGHLTEKQEAAVCKATAKAAERKAQWLAEREQREASAATIDVSKIKGALDVAKANSVKWPKLRFAGFTFSRAGDASKNPGAVYVTTDADTYLGKILGGRFTRSRDCSAELEEKLLYAAANPEEAAKVYGLQTGICSCCGRELTNPASIERGIGPICAGKFGWAF